MSSHSFDSAHFWAYDAVAPWARTGSEAGSLPSIQDGFASIPSIALATAGPGDSGPGGNPPLQPFNQILATPSLASALPPLATLENSENLPPNSAAFARIAKIATKVAGARRTSSDFKGKGQATTCKSLKRSGAVVDLSQLPAKKRGRAFGAANYSSEDVDALLNILEDQLPLGGKAWIAAAETFNDWAKENRRPVRTSKSLENKFKQLVRTEKPTGDAECPPEIDRAHSIEYAMNEKAGSRDLNDEDIADADTETINVSSDDDDSTPTVTPKPPKVKTERSELAGPVARRPAASNHHQSRHSAHDLIATLSSALDPNLQATRSEERSVRSFQTTQIMTLSNQLRDSQAMVENLRNQIIQSERGRYAAERRADRSELLAMINAQEKTKSAPCKSKPCLRRQDVYYADGGSSTCWVGEDESDHARDSPGTRRYTHNFEDSPSPSTPATLPTSTSIEPTKN